MLDKFLKEFGLRNEVYLRIKVNPNSSKTEVREIMDGETIKINIKAIPEKGKANIEIIRFLAKEFKVNKGSIKIINGAGSRIKLIKIKSIF